MSNGNDYESFFHEEEKISEIIQNPILDEDKVALHDAVSFFGSLRKNWKYWLAFIGVLIGGLGNYIWYSQDFKNDTTDNIVTIKEDIKLLKSEFSDIRKMLVEVSKNEANIRNIEFRINELKKSNDIGMRLYRIEDASKE